MQFLMTDALGNVYIFKVEKLFDTEKEKIYISFQECKCFWAEHRALLSQKSSLGRAICDDNFLRWFRFLLDGSGVSPRVTHKHMYFSINGDVDLSFLSFSKLRI